MNYDNLTREEAVKECGLEAILQLDGENCDFTNRVTSGTGWDGFTELSATGYYKDKDGNERHVIAYYYQKNEDIENTEDLGSLDWKIDHYEIV